MTSRRIYLDYASLTPTDPRVIRTIMDYSCASYANPSSHYKEGVEANKALESARATVARFIHAHADEIVFTSGGTEANILALHGIVEAALAAGILKPHVIMSAIEHSSCIGIGEALEKMGCQVTYVPIDATGVVIVDELKKALNANTVLVSVMTVNNETGCIQPIREIAKVLRHFRSTQGHVNQSATRHYPLFHTDAAQAAVTMELSMETMSVDLMTLDSNKTYGPRGVGCLYVRRGTPIAAPLLHGEQERGLRPGTENLPGIVGFAHSLELIGTEVAKKRESVRLHRLRERMISGIQKHRPDVKVVGGSAAHQSPRILNVLIPGIDNEFLMFQLDAAGVSCSTKSACLRDDDESYVLTAMGVDSHTALRFSFGRWTTASDIRAVVALLKKFC